MTATSLLGRLLQRRTEQELSDREQLDRLVEDLAAGKTPRVKEAEVEQLLERCGLDVDELDERVRLTKQLRAAQAHAALRDELAEEWRTAVRELDAAVEQKVQKIAELDKGLEALRGLRDERRRAMEQAEEAGKRARELLRELDAAQADRADAEAKRQRRAAKLREFALQQLPKLEVSRKRLAAAVADAERDLERAKNADFATREALQNELGARQAELAACEADLADAKHRAQNAEAVAQLEAAARGEGVV